MAYRPAMRSWTAPELTQPFATSEAHPVAAAEP